MGLSEAARKASQQLALATHSETRLDCFVTIDELHDALLALAEEVLSGVLVLDSFQENPSEGISTKPVATFVDEPSISIKPDVGTWSFTSLKFTCSIGHDAFKSVQDSIPL